MPAPIFNQKKLTKNCKHDKKNLIQIWAEYTPNGKGNYKCKYCNNTFIIFNKENTPRDLLN